MSARKLKELTPAQYAFMSWLYANHPNLAKDAEEKNRSLSGFMDSLTSVFNSVIEKAPDLMNQYVAGKTQIEQLKANIARASAGQYPLNANGTVYTGGSVVPTVVSQVPTWVWFAGGAAVVALIFSLRK